MKYVIDAKRGKEYDVIVCGAGTAGVASYLYARDGISPRPNQRPRTTQDSY